MPNDNVAVAVSRRNSLQIMQCCTSLAHAVLGVKQRAASLCPLNVWHQTATKAAQTGLTPEEATEKQAVKIPGNGKLSAVQLPSKTRSDEHHAM